MQKKFDVPILFLIFNRPETTKRVFKAIREVRPSRLFIAADGPRKDRMGEKEKCEETREITEKIDWPCKVERLYRESNLGCRKAVSEAISWFFGNVEEGIILEDDCLPDPSFFNYCETLLKRYRGNSQVVHISGNNFQNGVHRGEKMASYYFSKYPHIWGWATWRRAWKKYSFGIDLNSKRFKKIEREMNFWERIYWRSVFMSVKLGVLDTWDYQWVYTCWVNRGLAIVPNSNLVLNIGFDKSATHSTSMPNYLVGVRLESIDKIIHPSAVAVDVDADRYTWIKLFGGNYKNFLKSLLLIPYLYFKRIFV